MPWQLKAVDTKKKKDWIPNKMYSLSDIIRGNLNELRREYRRTKNPKLFVALKEEYQKWANLHRERADDLKYADWTHELNKRTGYLISTHIKCRKHNKISHQIEKNLTSLTEKYIPKRNRKEFLKVLKEYYHWPELGKQPEPATGWPDEIIAINASRLSPDASGYLLCPAKSKGGDKVLAPFPGINNIRVPATLDLEWRLNPTNLFDSQHRFKSDGFWRNAGNVVGFLYHPDRGEFLIEAFRDGFHNGAAPALAYNEHGNYPFEEYVRGIYLRSEGTFLVKQKAKQFEKLLEKFAFYHKIKFIYEDFDKHLSGFVNREFKSYAADFINYFSRKLEKERGERLKIETTGAVLGWASQPLEKFKGKKYSGSSLGNDPDDWKFALSDGVSNFREALLYYHNFFLDKPLDKYWQVWPEKLTGFFSERAEIDLQNLPKSTGNFLKDIKDR